MQAITITDNAYEVEKASRSFAKELIFPAGCLPSLEVISRSVAQGTDARVLALDDITASYPSRWRRGVRTSTRPRPSSSGSATTAASGACGSSTLSWSEGGFRERRIGDHHLLFAKPAYRRPREEERLAMTSSSPAGPAALAAYES